MKIGHAFRKSLLTGALALCLTPAVYAQAPTVVNAIGEYDDGTLVQSVCLTYSEAMDPVTTLSKANYSITGNAITNVMFFTNLPYSSQATAVSNLVILQLTNQLTAGYKVNITGVKSAGGTAIAASTAILGTMDLMSNVDISTTEITTNGTTFGQAPGAYLVDASGNDIYNAADGFRFLYTTRTNSFDIVVQVPYVDNANQWTKAGLMIRELIDPSDGGSRDFYIVTTALSTQAATDGSGNGVNQTDAEYRDTVDTAAVSGVIANVTTLPYPNVWLRMARNLLVAADGTTNDVITTFFSTNDQDWSLQGRFNPTLLGAALPFPTNVFVGLCTTAHVAPPGTNQGTASYTNFGDYVVNVAITSQPQSQSVQEGTDAIFTVGATSLNNAGSPITVNGGGDVYVQWYTNGVAVPGANGTTYAPFQANLAMSGLKVYCEVFPNGSDTNVTSATATLTVVPNTTPPVVVSAGSLSNQLAGYEIGVIFSHPLDPVSATTLANYSLDNGAKITAARYVAGAAGDTSITPDEPGGARAPQQDNGVLLSVSTLNPADSYHLTVSNVKDVYTNTMASAMVVPVVASPYTWVSLGYGVTNAANPNGATNAAFAVGSNSFNLVNGGNAFWGTEDDITMVYETVNGDFDRSVQVEWSDFASHWARAGLIARADVNPANAEGATTPLYQTVISDPETNAIYGGAVDSPANDQYETNLRYDTGDATTGIRSEGAPSYPASYVRIKRWGQMISVLCSTTTNEPQWWYPIGTTDFSGSSVGLPEQLFVGMMYGCENGNISGQYSGYAGPDLTGTFAARFRNYGPFPQKPRGAATTAIGFKFGCDTNINTTSTGLQLSAEDIAGVNQVAQGNWNDLFGDAFTTNGAAGGLVGENETTGKAIVLTNLMIGSWGSPNLWTSYGPGSDTATVGGGNGGLMTGEDAVLICGYLDSGASSTTDVGITNLPSGMVSAGYDVIVYAIGGVSGRGGGYGVLDTNGNVLQGYYPVQAPASPTNFIQSIPTQTVAATDTPTNWAIGNFVVFTNLKASSIIVEANTTGKLGLGGTIRAPINAIQIVSPSGLIAPPPSGPTISVSEQGVITYTGVLRSASTLLGPWTVVSGATSPYTIPKSGGSPQFFVSATK